MTDERLLTETEHGSVDRRQSGADDEDLPVVSTGSMDLKALARLCGAMDIEPERDRPVDLPFMRDDLGSGPGSVWWYVTDTTGLKLIACQNEEHAEFVAAAILAVPVLIEIAEAALAAAELMPAKFEHLKRLRAALAKVSP